MLACSAAVQRGPGYSGSGPMAYRGTATPLLRRNQDAVTALTAARTRRTSSAAARLTTA